MPFQGMLITGAPAEHAPTITALEESALPPGEVLIRVCHSSLNYKDALALTQGAPVVRQFPMVPGIDLAGLVERSDDAAFAPGAAVLVNGGGLGETRWGGMAQLARVPAQYVLPLPAAFTAAEAMAIGTAGYTAAMCLLALERAGLTPSAGPVLVTGASGGVGSIALALLKAGGYHSVASTGKAAEHTYLQELGAAEVIDRATLSSPGKPLQKERWAAAIDSVGGHTLANVCASLRYGGAVAACGLAQGMEFPATVAPFILRGISLLGIDSVQAPRPLRLAAWERLAAQLPREFLPAIGKTIPLAAALAFAKTLLAGEIRGRLVVEIPA